LRLLPSFFKFICCFTVLSATLTATLTATLSFSLLTAFSVNASDSEKVNIQAKAAWVIERDVSPINNADEKDVRGGVFYRLIDNQLKVDANGKRARFTRYVEEIVNETGLTDSSQINISFDPEYQEVIFHSLTIVRDGQRFDRTSSAKMSILNRETELKSQIYNGKLTLNILINDLRIGDTIDYSYTRYGANPVYQNIFSYAKRVSWSTPVHEQHIRVLWGKAKPLLITKRNVDPVINEQSVEGFTEYSLRIDKQVAIDEPSETPDWYDPYGIVYFSETENWQQVIDWAMPMYELTSTADSVKQIADEIMRKNSSKSAQIAAALKYTQESIRYVGLEMGLNSHMPTPPEQTIDLAYGDCKDKTLLLIAILKAMGIEAHPALVNTDITKLVEELPPRVNAFDHVLVTLIHEDKRYWLDPTLNKQEGELAHIYQPNYAYALILDSEQEALTRMETEVDQSSLHITERYIIPKYTPQEVSFDVTTVYKGDEARTKQKRILKDGLQEISKNYEVYYQSTFPSLEAVSEMSVANDENKGILTATERYRITDFWEEEEHFEADFYPNEIRSAVFKPSQVKRDAPLEFSYPNNIKFDLILEFKSDSWEFDDADFTEDNDFFVFTKTERFADDILTVSYDYKAKVDHIAQDRIEEYLEARERMRDEAYLGIIKYRINEQSEEAVVDTEDDDLVDKVLWSFGGFYALSLIFIFVAWRIESSKRPDFEGTHFYPINLSKFIILSVFTMGIFPSYWTYRTWKAIKAKEDSDIMPIARGIFTIIWFYPLFNKLKADSIERFERNRVLPTWMAVIFALLLIASTIFSSYDDGLFGTFQFLIVSLLFIPFVQYINRLNIHDTRAQKYNSKWRIRHVLLVIIIAPILILAAVASSGVLPSDEVVSENKLMNWDKKFLYRKRVLPPTEEIIYFYSDASLSIREDGNGFTKNRVFSFWVDENDKFSLQSASFDEVKSIDVEYNEKEEGNSFITITRHDDTDFLLYVSNVNGGDERFAKKLLATWEQQK
jgi:transglutaminase-like putative cysteine protease